MQRPDKYEVILFFICLFPILLIVIFELVDEHRKIKELVRDLNNLDEKIEDPRDESAV
jgi:hypothetical protein